MKTFIFCFVNFLFFSCATQPSQSIQSNQAIDEVSERRISQSSNEMNPQVALQFINDYMDAQRYRHVDQKMLNWAETIPFATESFKSEFTKMVTNAYKKDPLIGLGFDPIFDAQDYPPGEFKIKDFNKSTGYLSLESEEWESFKVTMKLKHENGITLVDGCGVVNIPPNMRAER